MKVKPLIWKTDKHRYTEAHGLDGYYLFSENRLHFVQGDYYGRINMEGGDFKEAAQKHHNERVIDDYEEWVESETPEDPASHTGSQKGEGMTAPCVECGKENVLHSFLCVSCLNAEYLRLLDAVEAQRQESLTTKQALASAVADVDRFRAKAEIAEENRKRLASMLTFAAAQIDTNRYSIQLTQEGLDALLEIANTP